MDHRLKKEHIVIGANNIFTFCPSKT